MKRHVLSAIENLPAGSPVPTERFLADELGTSRTTVRKALSDLVAEGRLVRRQGSGTYVAEPKVQWPLQLFSFAARPATTSFIPATELLGADRVGADPEVATRLRIDGGAAVLRIERLRCADGEPVAVETSYLAAARFPGLIGHLRRATPLHAALERYYGVVAVSAHETIWTSPALPREAAFLKTDAGAPMLRHARQSFEQSGTPVEWVTSWYRGDRVMFVARLP